jgi:CheY-like chemotaxis protein
VSAVSGEEPNLDGLDADERDICLYLSSWGKQLVSEMDISRRAGAKGRFQEDPKWAVQALCRLAEKGIIESDSQGHYRLRTTRDKETPEKQGEPVEWSCRGKRILFVDDDADWREFVALILQDAGGAVLTARDATDALVQLEGGQVNLIILDLDLNGENGLELLKFLKVNHPDVPVILYSGLSHDDDTVRAMLRLGAHRYVRKGPLGELRQAVRMALQQVQQ